MCSSCHASLYQQNNKFAKPRIWKKPRCDFDFYCSCKSIPKNNCKNWSKYPDLPSSTIPISRKFIVETNPSDAMDESSQSPIESSSEFELSQNSQNRSRMLILRSDYLIHQDDDKQISLKQVEINTIACAFIGLGSKMNQFHQYIYENVKKLPNYVKTQKNNIMDTIKAFKNIWELEKFFENSEKIYLLVFVSSNELNIFDQFIIESELEKMNIPTIRYSFEELDNYELIENNGYLDLYVCVKVPDIGAQLSGSKRVTQLLCDESILFNHLYDAYNDIDRARSDASILKESFMEQYDFMVYTWLAKT
ncbi:hypothetical protein A3Q56_03662 [Intoshia linei]|uniref:Glutathione synthetase n=1 Tax=Intoshia linei TaxID=1819745 RepID=A0A177B4G6_9BILA|nr:hypothetical protein A3Q56_03662 [Intoshia linei]